MAVLIRTLATSELLRRMVLSPRVSHHLVAPVLAVRDGGRSGGDAELKSHKHVVAV